MMKNTTVLCLPFRSLLFLFLLPGLVVYCQGKKRLPLVPMTEEEIEGIQSGQFKLDNSEEAPSSAWEAGAPPFPLIPLVPMDAGHAGNKGGLEDMLNNMRIISFITAKASSPTITTPIVTAATDFPTETDSDHDLFMTTPWPEIRNKRGVSGSSTSAAKTAIEKEEEEVHTSIAGTAPPEVTLPAVIRHSKARKDAEDILGRIADEATRRAIKSRSQNQVGGNVKNMVVDFDEALRATIPYGEEAA